MSGNARALAPSSAKESAPAHSAARSTAVVVRQPAMKPPVVLQRKCACGGGCPRCEEESQPAPALQTKLTVNTPGDAFEQEADRVAELVVADQLQSAGFQTPAASVTPLYGSRAPQNPLAGATPLQSYAAQPSRGRAPPSLQRETSYETDLETAGSGIPVLQRKCACGGSDSHCGCAEPENEEPDLLQRKESTPSAGPVAAAEDVSPQRLGPGRLLDDQTLSYMESRFGSRFDHVRIHDGPTAAMAARSVNALAYTVGSDIVFGAGQYDASTPAGRRLLAHELTHVIQQSGSPSHAIQRKEAGPGDAGNDFKKDQNTEGGGSNDKPDNRMDCPKAPTGKANTAPPDPPCYRATYAPSTELDRWHFCLDSDTVVPTENLDGLDSMLRDQPPSTHFVVHGYASTEGETEYNFRLACYRAKKIASELEQRLRASLGKQGKKADQIDAEVQKRIEVGSRGPTSEFGGGREANRVVVVYGQIPGQNQGYEPSCELAPRHLGDVKPEIPCDAPTVDLLHEDGSDQLTHFHFCLDSDVLAATSAKDVAAFAYRQAASSTFVIHGFASKEGGEAYNKQLSCHRALRIARELINAGVAQSQIREVSGVGETDRFGDDKHPELNRVAIAKAEKGRIADIVEPKADPSQKGDENVLNEARTRLLAGQYRLEADTYISFWTCGRTASVRQAVRRLSIFLPKGNKPLEVAPTSEANGTEEGLGPNNVRLSKNALRSDNPVECTMGRIIDMAFHHAVIGNDDLGASLTGDDSTKRHEAGLHLIHLAGLTACQGHFAEWKKNPGREPSGIDKPLEDDPLGALPPPGCARPTQPSRLLPPSKGEKQRERPDFITLQKDFVLNKGDLTPVDVKRQEGGEDQIHAQHTTTTQQDVINATATVSQLGAKSAYGDYEIGFIQTILDDLTTANYVTGDQVLHKLPTPIRAAQLRDEPAPPEPWMSATAWKRPDSDGVAKDIAGSWKLNTDFAAFLSYFSAPEAPQRIDQLDFLQRKTSVAIWLASRRVGAPLDRFSVLFLDGIVYDVMQNFDIDIRRVGGDLVPEDTDVPEVEHEHEYGTGAFTTEETSSEPADSRSAQLLNPAASEIDLNRQQRKFKFQKAPDDGLSVPEFQGIVREILDNIKIFGSEDDMKNNTVADTPRSHRLGFAYSPLNITVPINRSSGRIGGNAPIVEGQNLGERALFHLRKALALRLQKRDYLKKGKSIALSASAVQALPGDKNVGNVQIALPALEPEPDLAKLGEGEANVIDNMAEMFACTDVANGFLEGREFGAVYWIDRDKVLHRNPSPEFTMSGQEDDCSYKMELPCAVPPAGMLLGTVHTHPGCVPKDPQATQNPSQGDVDSAKTGKCGFQHFVVSEFGVVAYYTNKRGGFRQDITDQLKTKTKTAVCRQVKSEEDLGKKIVKDE